MKLRPTLAVVGAVGSFLLATLLRLNGSAPPLISPLSITPTSSSSPKQVPSTTSLTRPPSSTTAPHRATPSSTRTTRPPSTVRSSPTTVYHATTTRPQPITTTTSPRTTTTIRTTTTVASSRSATGPLVNYYYGELSVTVSARGSTITSVKIGSLNDGGSSYSQSIDQNAIPQLIAEALAAKSANIQSISGASYTSAGFIRSLQGALAQLGI